MSHRIAVLFAISLFAAPAAFAVHCGKAPNAQARLACAQAKAQNAAQELKAAVDAAQLKCDENDDTHALRLLLESQDAYESYRTSECDRRALRAEESAYVKTDCTASLDLNRASALKISL